MREFSKPAADLATQLQTLVNRGLAIDSCPSAILYLQNLGYYRLSAYTRPFLEKPNRDQFKTGIHLNQIIHVYEFDRHFRLLILDAIERIEVGLRSRIINQCCLHYNDPHWYLDSSKFHTYFNYGVFIDKLEKEIGIRYDNRTGQKMLPNNPSERFIDHYYKEYDTPHLPPFWMSVELLTLGSLSILFKGLGDHTLKAQIALEFFVSAKVAASWIHALSVLRNHCAHHSRLWNREMSIKPLVPNLIKPASPNVHRIQGHLIIMLSMLDIISPQNNWRSHFTDLLNEYDQIDPKAMGFSQNWKNQPFWKIAK